MSRDAPSYRCGAGARWLPRVLAGATLAAAWIASSRAAGTGPDAPAFLRGLVMAAGAVLALGILRRGSVLRRDVRVDPDGMTIAFGGHRRTVEYRDLTSIRVRWPFDGALRWVPTVVLTDVFEQAWEVPTVLVNGPEWLDALLERAGRDELRAWTEARHVRRALERSGWFVPAGYVVAMLLLAGAIGMHFR